VAAYRAYEIRSADGIDALALAERVSKDPGHGEVRIRVRAVSLNYRDLATVLDPAPRNIRYPRTPCSDAAGEVVAVGPGVTRVSVGDRVASCFFQGWAGGPITSEAMASALGGAVDGVLAEEVVLAQEGVVAFPSHLSFAEAATLPCAGLTAWHALVEKGALKAGETVLLLGTGGVSIFALQFAVMHGARVVVTSSSDEKLERAHAMGAWKTVNYRQTPDWDKAVLELTGGRGADHVVEVGGPGTLQRSLAACRAGGRVSFIGILAGGTVDPLPIMRKSLAVQGIYVGSRRMFEVMNRAIEAAKMRPVIDRIFPFGEARQAFHAMRAAGHFGKLVIEV
jgi:NADPH:quinone reductase-like Zn-dependent oxidoreductase